MTATQTQSAPQTRPPSAVELSAVEEICFVALERQDGFGDGAVRIFGPGPGFWLAFSHSAEARDGAADPLDRWSDRVGAELATAKGWELVSLRGEKTPPMIRWLLRSGAAHPSPIGPLVSARHGLWLSVRFAAIDRVETPPPIRAEPSPCATCSGRPCETRCPVGAFRATGYDALACATHIADTDSASCATRGCAARRACPFGADAAPEAARAAFHMSAFVKNQLACAD